MKILLSLIIQAVIAIIFILLNKKIGWMLSTFILIVFEIWFIIFWFRTKKGKKINHVSRNGVQGARMFCIIIDSFLLVYVMELFKYINVLVMSLVLACIVIWIMHKEVINIFFENKCSIKTILVIGSIITIILDTYAMLTRIFPQIHYLQGGSLSLKEKGILIIISIFVATLTLPQNSIIARISTNNYRNNPIFKDDKDNKDIE